MNPHKTHSYFTLTKSDSEGDKSILNWFNFVGIVSELIERMENAGNKNQTSKKLIFLH